MSKATLCPTPIHLMTGLSRVLDYFINMTIIMIRIFLILFPFFYGYLFPIIVIYFRKISISLKCVMNFCDMHFLHIWHEQFIDLFTAENEYFFIIFSELI